MRLALVDQLMAGLEPSAALVEARERLEVRLAERDEGRELACQRAVWNGHRNSREDVGEGNARQQIPEPKDPILLCISSP
jgi:hypothetical protein